jgi:hypothetical protein
MTTTLPRWLRLVPAAIILWLVASRPIDHRTEPDQLVHSGIARETPDKSRRDYVASPRAALHDAGESSRPEPAHRATMRATGTGDGLVA